MTTNQLKVVLLIDITPSMTSMNEKIEVSSSKIKNKRNRAKKIGFSLRREKLLNNWKKRWGSYYKKWLRIKSIYPLLLT